MTEDGDIDYLVARCEKRALAGFNNSKDKKYIVH